MLVESEIFALELGTLKNNQVMSRRRCGCRVNKIMQVFLQRNRCLFVHVYGHQIQRSNSNNYEHRVFVSFFLLFSQRVSIGIIRLVV